jgi:hypothetical protein
MLMGQRFGALRRRLRNTEISAIGLELSSGATAAVAVEGSCHVDLPIWILCGEKDSLTRESDWRECVAKPGNPSAAPHLVGVVGRRADALDLSREETGVRRILA